MRERIDARTARSIRAVVLDVDGVMTDGGIYHGATSEGEPVELKRFNVEDGLAIHILREAGIEPLILTGRESEAVRIRAEELGIRECHQDRNAPKLAMARAVLDRRDWSWEEIAYLGDDLADLPVIRRVALPAAVSNAAAEVRAEAAWVGTRPGGHGAVREFVEALLDARDGWSVHVRKYVSSREDLAWEENA